MAKYNTVLTLPHELSKEVILDHEGGDLTSDSGVLLLSQADARSGVIAAMAGAIDDGRDQYLVAHTVADLVRARVLAIAAGYEDANDLNTMRHDPALKIACGRCPRSAPALASQPTLSRFENGLSRSDVTRLGKRLAECVVARLPARTNEVTLDIDATDDPCHGQQEFEGFNAYYDCRCYIPLLVHLTDEQGTQWPVAALLRPGGTHPQAGVRILLRHLVHMLRRRFPRIKIMVRADAGFGCDRVLRCLDRLKVGYVLGLTGNKVLQRSSAMIEKKCLLKWKRGVADGRTYGAFLHKAGSWDRGRQVVVKADVSEGGTPIIRYLVTNLWGWKAKAVDQFYCARGDRENRIKEFKLDLFSGRTSCHRFVANQGRLLMHLAAYVLWTVVRQAAGGTQWAKAQVGTLRLQLLKVAARVIESTRRIWIHLCSSSPYRDDWDRVQANLCLPPPAT